MSLAGCGHSNQSDALLADVEQVVALIRPAMEADAGGVEVVGIRDGVVLVRMLGTCCSCPSVSLTLNRGIEKTLKEHLSWVRGVERVT